MQADSLKSIYAEIPTINCKRKCQAACGPILMSNAELVAISCVVKPPDFNPRTLACTKLVSGACSIYVMRPLVCRLWGVVKAMQCPWGCVPDRWLPEWKSRELLARAEKL